MKTIGLTGGIGSGKSTVARILKHFGYPVYIADTEAAHLMNTSAAIRRDITERFEPEAYTPDGKVNRQELARIVFRDKDALACLNTIVHPRVMEDFEQWCGGLDSPLAFFESAILFEAGLNTRFKHIICVTAPEEVRIQRVTARDNTDAEQVRERINNQMEEKEKCRQSDFVLCNDGKRMILPQVLEIIHELTIKNK